MRLGFRHADSRYPFFWDDRQQPPARWNAAGEGPAQYLTDTPDGAWAEFLRHEEITDPADLPGVARSLWAIELPPDIDAADQATLPEATGGRDSYPACQRFAAERRNAGVTRLRAPSAALLPGAARGQVTHGGGLHEAPDRDGEVFVLYGTDAALRGWRAVERGQPPTRTLGLVRHFT